MAVNNWWVGVVGFCFFWFSILCSALPSVVVHRALHRMSWFCKDLLVCFSRVGAFPATASAVSVYPVRRRPVPRSTWA